MEPSEEQRNIIQAIRNDLNVKVDAVAGSGKTTTLLLAAKELCDKKFLAITYNSRLKAETRQKAVENELTNLEVHSFHSLGLKYFRNPCFTDTHILQIIKEELALKKILTADVIFLDECQDMTQLYYRFICYVLSKLKSQYRIVVLGDHLQCIYEFKDADSRFLTLADQVFPSKGDWVSLTLSTSYRITKPMESFINDVVLGHSRLRSVKASSERVKYVIGDPFQKVPNYIVNEIKMMLLNQWCKPDDIFILAPSIRGNNDKNPIKIVENTLVKSNIACFVPLTDEEQLKDEVIHGKVVFSSFHQSKGLERKVVFVMSFSMSFYFIFRDAPRTFCPNILYVASTRAKENLYLIGENNGPTDALPFLKRNLLCEQNFAEIVDVDIRKRHKRKVNDLYFNVDERMQLKRVTDLTRFLPDQIIFQINELCKMVRVKKPIKNIQIPLILDTKNGHKENVSDLNGIAIPTILEHRLQERISIQMDLQTNYLFTIRDGEGMDTQRKEWIRAIMKDPETPEDYLKLANIYSTYISGYLYKLNQIEKYDWLKEEMIEEMLQILVSRVNIKSDDLLFEHTLSLVGYEFGKKQIQIEGRADLIDNLSLWELKCVDELSVDHIIQLALYAWIWQKTEFEKRGSRKFRLLNIRTGEVLELRGIENLDMIAGLILDHHFRTQHKTTDEQFLNKCKDHKYNICSSPLISDNTGGDSLFLD
jgi:thymidine kinase